MVKRLEIRVWFYDCLCRCTTATQREKMASTTSAQNIRLEATFSVRDASKQLRFFHSGFVFVVVGFHFHSFFCTCARRESVSS